MAGKKYKIIAVATAAVLIAAGIWGIAFVKNRNRGPVRMVYIPKVIDLENDFWTFLLEGAQMAADEYGVELTIMAGSSEENYGEQIEKIEEAIAMEPDVLLLSPISYTKVTEAAKKVKEAGIKLVLVDSLLDEDIQDALVCTDNFNAGEKMGQVLLDIMPEEPVIGLVFHVEGSSTAMEREAGFRSAIGEYEDCIVDRVFTDSNYEKGYQVTMEMLKKHPDINLVVGGNEYSAVGAARAIRDLGMDGQIQMIGFDSSIEELQMLESGLFQAIVVQKPFNMGYLGVEKAVELLEGKSFDKGVDSGCEVITRENMYDEENQKLLFPFRNE